MMALVLAVLGLAAAAPAVDDVTNLVSAVQPQEVEAAPKASSAYNFKCFVDDVDVVLDQKAEKVGDALEVQQVRSHIGDATTLEWAHIGQHFFSDIDGRSEEKVMGTPGGDLGEFILAMSAYEDETKIQIDQATATGLLMEYLKTMSRSKFFLATSEHAHDNLTAASGCRNLDIADPPDEKKSMILEIVADASNVGSQHIKFMLQDPVGYGIRKGLVEAGVKAFHQVMWNKTFPPSESLCYMLLKGPHKEKGFVNIQTAQHCQDQGLAPLISPQTCYNSMFVNHPEAVIKFRAELAHFLAQSNKALAQTMITKMNEKGTTMLAKTASKILKGYPVFTVMLKKSKSA